MDGESKAPTFEELRDELLRSIRYMTRSCEGDRAVALAKALEVLCNLHANGLIR